MNPRYFVSNHFVPMLHVGDDHLSPDYLDRHVIVMYDDTPYPGLVLNVDTDDVLVRCMHRVGQTGFTGRQLKMFVGTTKTNLSLSFHHQHQ